MEILFPAAGASVRLKIKTSKITIPRASTGARSSRARCARSAGWRPGSPSSSASSPRCAVRWGSCVLTARAIRRVLGALGTLGRRKITKVVRAGRTSRPTASGSRRTCSCRGYSVRTFSGRATRQWVRWSEFESFGGIWGVFWAGRWIWRWGSVRGYFWIFSSISAHLVIFANVVTTICILNYCECFLEYLWVLYTFQNYRGRIHSRKY